jgi:hypothetical protein
LSSFQVTDALHLGEVDHHTAVGHGAAGDVMSAAPNRHLKPAAAGKRKRCDDVLDAPSADDQRRLAVDEAVVHGACRVIARMIGREHRTGDAASELIEKMVVQRSRHVVPFC